MFTRLEISHHGCIISLEAHELIAILLGIEGKTAVPSLIETLPRERCYIPKAADYDLIKQKYIKQSDHDFLSGHNDIFLLMPHCIAPISTIGQYYYVTDQLRHQATKIELDGWWLVFGDRVLFLKNQDKRTRFYICDYGLKHDIYDAMKRIIIDKKWHKNTNATLKDYISEFYTITTTEYRQATAQHIFRSLALIQLHEEYPSRTPEQLLAFRQLILNDAEFASKIFERLRFEVAYYADIIVPHCKEFFLKNPDYLSHSRARYPNSQRIRNNLFKRIIAITLMEKINKGDRSLFFRPYHAYGAPDSDGPSYKEFSKKIVDFKHKAQMIDSDLAKQLREIILNKWTHRDDMDFLPALAAAWFIAEGSRNPLSIPTNLMLLDIIENRMLATLTVQEFELLYSWQGVFVHPNEARGITNCTDLYGDAISWDKNHTTAPIMYFRGSHPMVHFNSKPHATLKLSNGIKLTAVRQKEASLILHWLYCHLTILLPNYSFRLIKFDENDKTTYLPKTDYKTIASLIAQLTKKTKSFKKIDASPILSFKFRLLENYVIPLLHERCSSLKNTNNLFFDSRKTLIEKKKPAIVAPSIGVVALPEPLFRLTLRKSELYSLVVDACKQYDITLRVPFHHLKLQAAVATELLHYYSNYLDIISEQLQISVLHQCDNTDLFWITGLAQLVNDNNHLLVGPFLTNEVNVKELLEKIQTEATLSALEASLPDVLGVSQHLQKTLQSLKVLCFLWFSDAIWFRKKAKFLTELLKNGRATILETNQINKEIDGIKHEAKRWDTIYNNQVLVYVKSEEYHHAISDNARVQGKSICHLDLYVIAQLLNIRISLFTERKDQLLPAVCVQTHTGNRLFYHRRTFTSKNISSKQASKRHIYIFKDKSDNVYQSERLIEKSDFIMPKKIPMVYPKVDKAELFIERFIADIL